MAAGRNVLPDQIKDLIRVATRYDPLDVIQVRFYWNPWGGSQLDLVLTDGSHSEIKLDVGMPALGNVSQRITPATSLNTAVASPEPETS